MNWLIALGMVLGMATAPTSTHAQTRGALEVPADKRWNLATA